MYKLHSFAQSGNCYKVALLLDVLDQPWEPVFIDFRPTGLSVLAYTLINKDLHACTASPRPFPPEPPALP